MVRVHFHYNVLGDFQNKCLCFDSFRNRTGKVIVDPLRSILKTNSLFSTSEMKKDYLQTSRFHC